MKVKGREWHWWVIRNDHSCRFCDDLRTRTEPHGVSLGKIVRDETGLCQADTGYWRKLYYVWLRHMKECHRELI